MALRNNNTTQFSLIILRIKKAAAEEYYGIEVEAVVAAAKQQPNMYNLCFEPSPNHQPHAPIPIII